MLTLILSMEINDPISRPRSDCARADVESQVHALSKDLVHDLCALGERGADLVAIDGLGGGCALVTD